MPSPYPPYQAALTPNSYSPITASVEPTFPSIPPNSSYESLSFPWPFHAPFYPSVPKHLEPSISYFYPPYSFCTNNQDHLPSQEYSPFSEQPSSSLLFPLITFKKYLQSFKVFRQAV